ncbi:hypothetical protein FRACYDRAFT_251631 [Fragilariopsis cylindrus CCMP1102]|uniref:Uncharacterized protein n=1 Tax=Fragilariopsis cylindrus CCMP1102 TaxID=635003 RepID=A0A1E7EMI6_9STRA|nr:hypothetical protein FRACYDRAFT_251631 [Fragilariopsis cylindrus CCMP1102]|eukprot:OEU07148.1 hypothetical protein FRACYDRAFT_251631 [Fragilariopsis cylindrus CCMP1102]
MAKSNRNNAEEPAKEAAKAKRVHRISGFKPFLYDAEQWDTKSPSQILKTTENGNRIDNKMFILQGDETPEQLIRIVDKEAQTIVSNVETAFESYEDAEDIDKIEDLTIRDEIRDEYPDDATIEAYFTAGTAAQKRMKITHIIRECMYHLKLKIFGNETLGRSSFIQLKRSIRNMKISPQLGVAAWSKRFDTFQLYLPMCLWDAGAKKGLYPAKYDEENCREILEYALSPVYLTKLHDDGWCLQSNTYVQSITKLKEIEPGILKQLKFVKEQLQQAKDIAELQKGKGKSSSTASSKDRKQNGGEKRKRECDTCGKRHAGECWKLQSGGGNNGGRKGNNYNTFNKEAKQYMKAMFARQASGASSDSSDSDDEQSWKQGLNQKEQMHVLASAGFDPSERNINFDPSDLKRYKKQAKKPTPVLVGTVDGTLYPSRAKPLHGARRFCEVLLSIVNDNGHETMARCLLDTGCTKSMILKQFTDKKRRTKLSKENTIRYETYGSTFHSSMTASVGFKMIEFENQKNQTIEYKFQVDETSNPRKQQYDVIIGNDLLWNMGINILFKEQEIQWNEDKIPLKTIGQLHSRATCNMLYSMHTDSPLLQDAEERQNKMLECNYSKVNIDAMVNDLDIDATNKEKLKKDPPKVRKGSIWWRFGNSQAL